MTDRPHSKKQRREQRRFEATTRQLAAKTQTPAQRLDALDALLGKDKGARKERARLVRLL